MLAMGKKQIKILTREVDERFLAFVRRPSRYIGGEVNQIKKDLSACNLTVALCFPDVYEVGASYTGLAIIYDVLNNIEGIGAERVFAPWLDAEEILRREKIPLFSLESKAALGSFDVVGFALTTELCYSNVLGMLDLGGIAIRSSQRSENEPLIIAGGCMTNCCEPMAEFIDLFVLGEAEETVIELVKLITEQKKAGSTKKQILLEAAKKFPWAYVPGLYEFEYHNDKIKSFEPKIAPLSVTFQNAVVEDFDNAPVPLHPIVPFAQAVHERVSVEIMRGCPGRCRFCQASFCRRPIRYRSIERIVEIAKEAYHATGFDTISLLSLSTADYPELEKLIAKLHDYFRDRHVGISLPSLRVDAQLKLLPELAGAVRKSGLTIAVEAASRRLRKIINKPVSDEDLFAGVEAAYEAGWRKVKLYFMVGLPGETQEDIKSIVDLSYKIARARRKVDGKTAQVNIAISWLVPKPHTPFGWLGQRPASYFRNAKDMILERKRELGARFLWFKFHDINRSILEAAITRGDRRLADCIETAWRSGAKFDLWDECFDYKIWRDAFTKCGMDLEAMAHKEFEANEILPWQQLGGPDKNYLRRHFTDAMQLAETEA